MPLGLSPELGEGLLPRRPWWPACCALTILPSFTSYTCLLCPSLAELLQVCQT